MLFNLEGNMMKANGKDLLPIPDGKGFVINQTKMECLSDILCYGQADKAQNLKKWKLGQRISEGPVEIDDADLKMIEDTIENSGKSPVIAGQLQEAIIKFKDSLRESD